MLILLFLFLAGALTGLTFPPYGYWPLLFIIYPYFCFTLVNTTSKRQAFYRGWSFGFGHFIATLYWVPLGLMLPGIDLGFLIPPILVGLPLFLGLFIGIAALLFKVLCPRKTYVDLSAVLLFVSVWMIVELIRGHLFTGFPWNLLGTVFWNTPLFQTLSWWGIYGLSFITVLVVTLPVLIRRHKGLALLTPVLVIGVLWGVGHLRLAKNPTEYQEGPYIRLVQAYIDQGFKWNPDLAHDHLDQHMALSVKGSLKPLTHIIWPETAVPFLLNGDEDVRAKISGVLVDDTYLIVGASKYERFPDKRLANSLFVLNAVGEIVASYDKQHLLPFAEYIPFADYIPYRKLMPFTENFFGPIDFSPGDGIKNIKINNTPVFSPSICYEIIFSGEVVKDIPRPEWMLNLTNDGWFGATSGPYQHFEIARMRAIEEGLPLVRSTNTGISAFIDAYGRVTAQLNLGEKGVVDGPLPKPITSTIFVKGGQYLIYLFLALILLPLFLFWRRKNT